MKKRKKLVALLMVAILCIASLTACGSKKDSKDASSNKTENGAKKESGDSKESSEAEGDTAKATTPTLKDAKLKVWGPQEQQDTLAKLCDQFKALHKEANIEIDYGVVSESDAKTEVLKDASAAADVFTFASDQIAELQAAGALYRVTLDKDAIVAANSEGSIKASTVNGEMYGYPSSAETYFMYYDKSKYTEDEIKNLNTMVKKDLGKGITNFSFDSDNGWYLSAFFFAAGCQLFGADGTDATQCDFNNAQGLLVGKYLLELAQNKKVKNHDDALLLKAFETGKLGASLTGTWNADAIKKSLGDNFGVAKLPTITLSDGKDYQLSGMANFKLYGVNSQTKHPAEAMALAEFLTSKDAQKVRFEKHSAAPTNLELANDSSIMSTNAAVQALTEASQVATLQTSIPQVGNFWTPAEALGTGINDGSVTDANLQEKLDAFVKSVLATLK